jgi:hypothetical protein
MSTDRLKMRVGTDIVDSDNLGSALHGSLTHAIYSMGRTNLGTVYVVCVPNLT